MKWCVSVQDMKDAENRACAQGILQEDLIRRVAQAIFVHAEFQKLLKTPGPILLFVGRGCNGLDCLALGCALLRSNKQVLAYQLPRRSLTDVSTRLDDEFIRLGGSFLSLEQIVSRSFALVIDGLLGTGMKREHDAELYEAIRVANCVPAPIVAIDLPSGVSPETGEIWDTAICAEYTFACQAPKKGLFFQKAWEHVGAMYVVDVGLPISPADIRYIEEVDCAEHLPVLERMTHKYRRGTVHVVAGSQGMMGAAHLAVGAAFAAGSGYVHAYVPLSALTESVLLPVEAVRTFYNPKRPSFSLPNKGVLVVGPGLGKSKQVENLVKMLVQKTNIPMVLDGDGLYGLQPFLKDRQLDRVILTPHRKEAERLFGGSCDELSSRVFDHIKQISCASGAYIVLKGSPTVLFSPEGSIDIMGRGTPALATAGSGDVLAGILGSLLSQGLSREYSCRVGTFLHALAGAQAENIRTTYSVRAEHILDALPFAYRHLLLAAQVTFSPYRPVRLLRLDQTRN